MLISTPDKSVTTVDAMTKKIEYQVQVVYARQLSGIHRRFSGYHATIFYNFFLAFFKSFLKSHNKIACVEPDLSVKPWISSDGIDCLRHTVAKKSPLNEINYLG